MKRISAILLSALLVVLLLGNTCMASKEYYAAEEILESGVCDGRFVIVSESSDVPLIIRCSQLTVEGELFSNCAIEAKTQYKCVTPNGVDLYSYGLYQEVFDYGENYDYYVNSHQYYGNEPLVNGYSEEKLFVTGNKVQCGSIMGAGGRLDISASKVSKQQNMKDVILFSLNENIGINAETIELSGLIYAPNGRVEINANEFFFDGIIIADEVVINANRVTLLARDIDIQIGMYGMDDEDICYDIFSDAGGSSSNSSSGSGYYYNNNGEYSSSLYYGKYNIANRVKNGDIIYEAAGGFNITGHIAMVYEVKTVGTYIYGSGYHGHTYVVVAEAIDVGVCKGTLDDTRIDERKGKILRVKDPGLSAATLYNIKFFIDKQMGKPYKLDLGRQQTGLNSSNWYCSELIYAAYYYAGIDISPSGFSNLGIGITPRDITRSSKLKTVFSR